MFKTVTSMVPYEELFLILYNELFYAIDLIFQYYILKIMFQKLYSGFAIHIFYLSKYILSEHC